MTKPNNFKNDSMSRDKETKKSTKKTGVSTSINAAAILDILERFSGYIQNGEMVKLRLETPAKSLDRSLGIKELLKNQYGISLKVDTIRNNLIGLQSLFDKIKRNRNYYWIEHNNILDEGEYKILKAKIESDDSLSPTEKAGMVGKIDSISSSSYSKKLGSLDNSPTSNIALLGNKNIKKTVEIISKAIESEFKISFQLNVYNVNAQPCELEDIVTFSPYGITDVKGKFYVIGLEDGVGQLTHYRIDKLSKVQIVKQTIDARDKNSKLQRYLEAHPFMSGSKKLVRATLKITKSDDPKDDILGEVFEHFGRGVKIRTIESERFFGEEYYLVDNLTASDEEVLMFALMYANRVELLSDNDKTKLNPLRGALRKTGASLSEKYLKTPEDKYLAEVDKCSDMGIFAEYHRKFSVPGFDLSKRTEHHNLDLRFLSLRSNNITDISFVSNYKKLAVFKNCSNDILDYSPLVNIETLQEISLEHIETENLSFIKECKSLRKLTLNAVYVSDYSALYSNLALDYLVLYHLYGIDVELIKANNPYTEVIVANEKDKVEAHINPVYPINNRYTAEYPLNIIREFFNVDQKDVFDISDDDMATIDAEVLGDAGIIEAADQAIASLCENEKAILTCIMKEHLSIRETALKLGMRTGICINLFETARRRFNHSISGKTEFYELATARYSAKVINRSLKKTNISERGKAQRRARLKRVMYCSDDKLIYDEE